ncbi:MAG TPA: M20/M25/M40 family metallo-hydrolase, partial [Polyangia bacterium]
IDTTFAPQSFPAPEETTPQFRLQTALERTRKEVANVIGLVPGTDPALRSEVVVVGAHYDHLGHGGLGSLVPDEKKVHPGADDNASGVSGMLAIAEAAAKGPKLKRSLVFIAFAGEEVGLRGSSHYVANLPPGQAKVVAMLNLDMVGRLREKRLIVQGADSAKEWRALVMSANTDQLSLSLGGDGYGPSDHTAFYARGVPVLFFFTGAHEDYHKPSDTADKLNYDGIAAIAKLGYRVVKDVADRPAGLTYVRSEPKSLGEGGRGYGPYLGTIPDFGEAKAGAGVKLSGVRKGSPAEKAGLQAGDVLVKLGDTRLRNLEEYAIALRQRKPGDVVKLTVLRDGKELTVAATLEQRK